MPRPIKPRTCRRRLQGKRLISFVASFNIDGNGVVSVTAARRFVAENKVKAPAVINVKRNDYTIDRFFLAEKGMFGLIYVEFNWMLFPCLKKLEKNIGPRELFADLDQQEWSSEEESYREEFAFI